MDGPTDHLEAMVQAHWRELHCMLTAITGNSSTAEDLTQEVFVLAVREGLKPGPGARTWFRRAARFLALNELRRRRPLPLAPSDMERICDAGFTPASADDDAGFDESLAALRLCVQELKEADRRLLAARYEKREPLDVISGGEQQSVGYLKQRLFRLRLRLRACVNRRLGRQNGSEDESGNVEADPVPA